MISYSTTFHSATLIRALCVHCSGNFLTHTQKKESYITEFIVNGGNLHETECNHAHSDRRTVTLA